MTKYLLTIVPAAALAFMAVTASGQNANASGKKLFVDYSCYACHGFSGQNGPGKRLVPMNLAKVAFTAYVRNPGTRQMPSYSNKVLSDAQLGEIWDYVKTLPDSKPAKDIPLLQEIAKQ